MFSRLLTNRIRAAAVEGFLHPPSNELFRQGPKTLTVAVVRLHWRTDPQGDLHDPEAVRELFARVIGGATEQGWSCDALLGSYLLCFPGSPSEQSREESAVRGARRLVTEGGPETAVSVALVTGRVTTGEWGSESRAFFDSIGTAVDTALDLARTLNPGEIALDEATRQALAEQASDVLDDTHLSGPRGNEFPRW